MFLSNDIEVISDTEKYKFVHNYYELAEDDHFWMEGRFQAFVNFLKRIDFDVTQARKGMEIGCGNGVVIRQSEQMFNWIVDGSDIDINGLKYNTTNKGKLFQYNILEKSRDFKEKYDFLLLFDVLEHIEKTQEFIDACLFHLKENGYLFLNVPALPFLFGPYDKACDHYRRYTKKTLLKEFESKPMQCIGIQYWGLTLIPFLMLRNIFTSSKVSSQQTVNQVLGKPHRVVHKILKAIIQTELEVIQRPLVGTSLIVAFQKRQ